jgi:NhaP-type Na+/H+ and K+/H+ antiporter
LIALQINNWNEDRKKENLEIQYLKRLTTDLKSDIDYFDYRIKKAEKMIDDTKTFVEESYSEQKTEEDFRNLISIIVWDSEQMTVQNTTYIELMNGGFLNLIRNEVLKTSLIELYKHYEEVNQHIKEFNQATADGLVDSKNYFTIVKYYPMMTKIFDKSYMFNDQEWSFINHSESFAFRILEENVGVYALKYYMFLNHFKKLEQETNELILIIDNELSERN